MISKNAKPKPRSAVPADAEMGQRIRARRIEQNMTQQELGKLLGVSFQQVQKYEKGANRINANRLALIASALNMRPEEFYQSEKVMADVSSLIDVISKDTLRMIRAYSRIKDQAAQRQMVALVETIAEAQDRD